MPRWQGSRGATDGLFHASAACAPRCACLCRGGRCRRRRTARELPVVRGAVAQHLKVRRQPALAHHGGCSSGEGGGGGGFLAGVSRSKPGGAVGRAHALACGPGAPPSSPVLPQTSCHLPAWNRWWSSRRYDCSLPGMVPCGTAAQRVGHCASAGLGRAAAAPLGWTAAGAAACCAPCTAPSARSPRAASPAVPAA